MLYEALTGSLPFDTTGRPSEVIQRILETPPTSPSSHSNRVDGELATILLKALAKEKGHRYPSAKAMGEDIGRYLEGEPILARRPSSLYFLRKKVLKHRWAAILCVVVVVAALIGLGARSHRKQQRWAQARRSAILVQRTLEAGDAVSALAAAQTLKMHRPKVWEAHLTYTHAQYRNERTRISGRLSLERAMQYAPLPAQWAFGLLLAEVYRDLGDAERADRLQARAEREAGYGRRLVPAVVRHIGCASGPPVYAGGDTARTEACPGLAASGLAPPHHPGSRRRGPGR